MMRVVVESPCLEHGEFEKHHPAHGSCPGAEIGGYVYCGSRVTCGGSRRVLTPGEFLLIEVERYENPVDTIPFSYLYPQAACDALEALLRKRGVYPTSGPVRGGQVGSEEILDCLFDALIVGER